MKNLLFVIFAICSLFVDGLREQFCTANVEYTDLASFTRLTGLAYFKADAGADAGINIPFGNITMIKLPTNPKTVSANLNKRGGVTLAKRDTYMVEPVWEITSDQFAEPTFPLQLMGDAIADWTQSIATGSTYTFTAKAGRAYYIGAKNATIKHVKVSTSEMIPGVDYFIDDYNVAQPTGGSLGSGFVSQNGWIMLPVTAAGITDGASVVVTYDCGALTRKQYTAFSKLNRSGTLTIELEDASGGDPREEWIGKVQLSVKQVGDNDPAKFRETILEAAIFGSPTISHKA